MFLFGYVYITSHWLITMGDIICVGSLRHIFLDCKIVWVRARVGNLRPAKEFYLVHDLLLSQPFFLMHQLTVEMILISWQRPFFLSSPSIQPQKALNFWRRPFLLGLCHQFGQKMAWTSGEDLSFLVRWNGGGPLELCLNWMWPTSSKGCQPLG